MNALNLYLMIHLLGHLYKVHRHNNTENIIAIENRDLHKLFYLYDLIDE